MSEEDIIENWKEAVSIIDEKVAINKHISRSKLSSFLINKKLMNEKDAEKCVKDAIRNGILIKVENGSLKLSDNSKNKLIEKIKMNNPDFDASAIWKRILTAHERTEKINSKKSFFFNFLSLIERKIDVLSKIPVNEMMEIFKETVKISRMYFEGKTVDAIINLKKKILSYELDQNRDAIDSEIKKIVEGYGISI